MALGKCVLVSDIPENLETIGDAGFSFKHGNVEDLREKLKLLLANPGIVDVFKQKAVNRINTYYNWNLITDDLFKLYIKTVLGHKPEIELDTQSRVVGRQAIPEISR
jgi:glycosyltransferase involved in cell wall biosynthesis